MALGHVSYEKSQGNQQTDKIFDIANTENLSFVDSSEESNADAIINAFVEKELQSDKTHKDILLWKSQGKEFDDYFEQTANQQGSPLSRLFEQLKNAQIIEYGEENETTRNELANLEIQLTYEGTKYMADQLKTFASNSSNQNNAFTKQAAQAYNSENINNKDIDNTVQILKKSQTTQLQNLIVSLRDDLDKQKETRTSIEELFIANGKVPINVIDQSNNNKVYVANFEEFIQLGYVKIEDISGELTNINGVQSLKITSVYVKNLGTSKRTGVFNDRSSQATAVGSNGNTKQERTNTVIGYQSEQTYQGESVDHTTENQRQALRRIKKAFDGLAFDEETTPQDKIFMRQFAKGMKTLGCIRGGSENDMGKVIAAIIKIHNEGEKDATIDPLDKNRWKENAQNYDIDLTGNLLAKSDHARLAQLSSMYDAFRHNSSGMPYTHAMFDALSNYVGEKGGDATFNVSEFYNDNTREYKDIKELNGLRLDGNAINGLYTLYAETGSNRGNIKQLLQWIEQGKVDPTKFAGALEDENHVVQKPKKMTKEEADVREIYSDGMSGTTNPLYNLIIDGLASGSSIESMYRQQLLLRHGTAIESENANTEAIKTSHRIINLLADTNSDGRIDHHDGALLTGLQIKDLFKTSIIDIQAFNDYENEDMAHAHAMWKLLTFCWSQAHKSQNAALGGKINDFLGWKEGHDEKNTSIPKMLEKMTGDDFINFLQNNPGVLQLMQRTINSSPLPLSYIFTYGPGELTNRGEKGYAHLQNTPGTSAFEKRHDETYQLTLNSYLTQAEKIELQNITAQKRAEIKKLAGENGTSHLLNDEGRIHFETQFSGLMIQMLQDANGKTIPGIGGGIGGNIDLQHIAQGLRFNFGAGIMTSNEELGMLGVSISYDKQLSDKLGLYANGGLMEFIPCSGPIPTAGLGLNYTLSEKSDNKDLTPGKVKTIRLDAGIRMIGPIPVGRIGLDYDIDKLKQINQTQKEIGSQLANKLGPALAGLKAVVDRHTGDNNTDLKKTIRTYLKSSLLNGFNGDEKVLNQNLDNLRQAITYFANNDFGGFNDPQVRNHVTSQISDLYALERRNRAISGLNKKVHFSGANIGAAFLFEPAFAILPTAVVSFSRYKNIYHEDSEYSKEQTKQGEINGIGNKEILPGKSMKDHVNYMNQTIKSSLPQRSLAMFEDAEFIDKKVLIPRSWYNALGAVNVRISKELLDKQCIDYTDKDGNQSDSGAYLSVPANTMFRLMKISQGKDTGFVLNIGSATSSNTDALLQRGREEQELPEDKRGTKEYTPLFGQERLVIKSNDITTQIKTLVEKNTEKHNNFPLNLLGDEDISVNGQTIQFNKIPAKDVVLHPSVKGSTNPDGTQSFEVQTNQVLQVTRLSNGTFFIEAVASNRSKFRIEYITQANGQQDTRTERITFSEYESRLNIQTRQIDTWISETIINNQKNLFAKATHESGYKTFRRHIDNGQYDEAKQILDPLLAKVGVALPQEIINTLNECNFSTNDSHESRNLKTGRLAALLAVFDGAFSPVDKEVQVTGLGDFAIPGGTDTLFGKRTNALARKLGSESVINNDTNTINYFKAVRSAAMGPDTQSYTAKKQDNTLGMVFGYASVHQTGTIETQHIAEKFVSEPMLAEGRTAQFAEKNHDGSPNKETRLLKQYFIDNLCANGDPNHPMINAVRYAIKAKIGATFDDKERSTRILPGILQAGVEGRKRTITDKDGKQHTIDIQWNLGLGFYARCCNENLLMQDLAITITSDSMKTSYGADVAGTGEQVGSFLVNTTETRSSASFARKQNINLGIGGRFGKKEKEEQPVFTPDPGPEDPKEGFDPDPGPEDPKNGFDPDPGSEDPKD